MKILITFIPENIVNALGWTIFHSLWQGFIIGIILFLIFRLRRNIPPQLKYLLGIFALVAILASSLLTFFIEYHPASSLAETTQFSSTTVPYLAGLYDTANGSATISQNLLLWQQRLIKSFDIVSIIWLIGVFLLSVRLAGGMLVINGIRRQQVSLLHAEWELRFHLLADKTGVRRSITFLQSQRITVPTVIGVLRPVIIIPAMIISGLPADQLETIIVHELAHIRRHDFLINILQSTMEALFFYHPVVWIISENVRQEREKCCDDFAVRVCGKISLYARALAGLSEMQISSPIPSVAITGNRNNIVHRVERLINNKKMKKNTTERIVAGLVLMTTALIITLSTGASLKPSALSYMQTQIELPYLDGKADIPPAEPEPVIEPAELSPVRSPAAAASTELPSPVSQPARVSMPAPVVPMDTSHRHDGDKMDIKDNIVTREFHNKDGEDHEMKFVIRQGKVKELYVDGQRIPDNKISQYQKEIDVTLKDLGDREKDLKYAREELEDVDFDEIREQIILEMERFNEHDMQELHMEMERLSEEQLAIHLDKQAMQAELQQAMKDVQIDQEKIREEMLKAQEEMKIVMQEYEHGSNKLSEKEFKQIMKDLELGLVEVKEEMAMMEKEDIQKMMDEVMKSVQEIDFEKMQREIEETMKEINEIDFAEIEREMQAAMQDMDKEKFNLEKEKKKINEMIDELEKLELDK